MKKLFIYSYVFIFANFNNLFGWVVKVNNLSNENIQVRIGTSQSYPCGNWYAACMDQWCDCGGTINVAAGKTEDFNYNRPRTCSADYICTGACTTSLELVGKGISTNVLGGVGACSDVEVYVVKDEKGKWVLSYTDWTDTVVSYLQKNIEPMVTMGFRLSTLIPNATQANDNINKITKSIDGFTKQIDGVSNTVNKLMDQINKETKDITTFIDKTGVQIKDFQEKLPAIQKGDLAGTLTLFDQINKLKVSFEEAKVLLQQFMVTYESIENQINAINLRPLVLSLVNLVDVIKNLIGNIATIIDSVPDWLIAHDVVGPLQTTANDLNALNDQLKALTNEKYFSVQEIQRNIVNGILSNPSQILKLAMGVKESVDKIVSAINKLTGTSIPSLTDNVAKLSKAINSEPGIKEKLIEQLKRPENIAVLVPGLLVSMGSSVVSIVTFGAIAPIINQSSSAILKLAKPAILSVFHPVIKEANLSGIVNAADDMVNTIKTSIDEVIKILKTLNDAKIKIFPDNVTKIITNMGQIVERLNNDVAAVKKTVGSLTGETSSESKGSEVSGVISATYGAGNQVKDVTSILQSKTRKGAFEFKGAMNSLFGDPAPQKRKQLTIVYVDQNGNRQTKTLQEDDAISLPAEGADSYNIVEATYGTKDRKLNVTSILVRLSRQKPFNFAGGTDSMNKLFGDPTPGIAKQLKIVYTDKSGSEKTKVVNENEPFSLP